jgi:NTP pyrophosphatase (non-canonical NTP hydrolase)
MRDGKNRAFSYREAEARVYVDIAEERRRAHLKHGPHGGSVEVKYYQDFAWLPILVEEVGEVANEINEYSLGVVNEERYRRQLRAELIQVAAMATAWVEAIDRA